MLQHGQMSVAPAGKVQVAKKVSRRDLEGDSPDKGAESRQADEEVESRISRFYASCWQEDASGAQRCQCLTK